MRHILRAAKGEKNGWTPKKRLRGMGSQSIIRACIPRRHPLGKAIRKTLEPVVVSRLLRKRRA